MTGWNSCHGVNTAAAASTRWCRGYTLKLTKYAFFSLFVCILGCVCSVAVVAVRFFPLALFTITLETDRAAEGGE